MDILRKILDIILTFLKSRDRQVEIAREDKVEEEEKEAAVVKQKEKASEALEVHKKVEIKKPKKGDFFNDENW